MQIIYVHFKNKLKNIKMIIINRKKVFIIEIINFKLENNSFKFFLSKFLACGK